MSTKFSVTIRCLNPECNHKYSRVMSAPDEETLAVIPDPPCPKCSRKPRKKRFDYAAGTAPAVGGSLVVRAVDQTAAIVMADHHLTDLRSDVREGETMAPKLPPRLQAMADGMFSRPKRPGQAQGLFGLNPAAVRQAAVNGRFNTPDTVNPIAVQHSRKDRAPVHIVAGDNVRPSR